MLSVVDVFVEIDVVVVRSFEDVTVTGSSVVVEVLDG